MSAQKTALAPAIFTRSPSPPAPNPANPTSPMPPTPPQPPTTITPPPPPPAPTPWGSAARAGRRPPILGLVLPPVVPPSSTACPRATRTAVPSRRRRVSVVPVTRPNLDLPHVGLTACRWDFLPGRGHRRPDDLRELRAACAGTYRSAAAARTWHLARGR